MTIRRWLAVLIAVLTLALVAPTFCGWVAVLSGENGELLQDTATMTLVVIIGIYTTIDLWRTRQ